MRLIDADKIEFVLPRTLTEEEEKTFSLMIKKAFENAPTVDIVTWKDFMDFLDDNAEDFDSIGERFDALEERLKAIEESEQKTEFVQIGGQKLCISPYKAESETVSWKDFEDSLDEYAEDFNSIDEKLDALIKQVSDLTITVGKIEGIVQPIQSNVPVMFNGTWYNPSVLQGGHYTVSNKTEEK